MTSNHEFKVGDKVIPLKKTVGRSLSDCIYYRNEIKNEYGKGYLYVVKIKNPDEVVLNNENNTTDGNYYHVSDLIPFIPESAENKEENKARLFEQYVRKEIPKEHYERLLRYIK